MNRRNKFEQFAKAFGMDLSRFKNRPDEYMYAHTAAGWKAWQETFGDKWQTGAGMCATTIAAEIAEAVKHDERNGQYLNTSSGSFGPCLSAYVRDLAGAFMDRVSED